MAVCSKCELNVLQLFELSDLKCQLKGVNEVLDEYFLVHNEESSLFILARPSTNALP